MRRSRSRRYPEDEGTRDPTSRAIFVSLCLNGRTDPSAAQKAAPVDVAGVQALYKGHACALPVSKHGFFAAQVPPSEAEAARPRPGRRFTDKTRVFWCCRKPAPSAQGRHRRDAFRDDSFDSQAGCLSAA